MAMRTKTENVTVKREAYDGMICDVCGQHESAMDEPDFSRFEMGMSIGEEGEFLIYADICFACADGGVGRYIHETLHTLKESIPGGSFRSSFGEWEATGKFVDE